MDVEYLPQQWLSFGGFECSVCLEWILSRDGIELEDCRHSYCRECLKGYVASKLSDKAVNLKCPDTNCRRPLQPSDIRSCTSDLGDISLWNAYEELATQTFLDKAAAASTDLLGASSTRRCPAERCNFLFQFEPDPVNGKLFICPECDNAFCLNCPVVEHKVGPAHDGGCQNALREIQKSNEKKRKLEEWKQLNAQADTKFDELLKSERAKGITKPCPKCMTPITKNQGCNHMHCTSCGQHYKWSRA